MLLGAQLKARLYLRWVSFMGLRFHRNSLLGVCKSKRETEVCSESQMYAATFLQTINMEFPCCLYIIINFAGGRDAQIYFHLKMPY